MCRLEIILLTYLLSPTEDIVPSDEVGSLNTMVTCSRNSSSCPVLQSRCGVITSHGVHKKQGIRHRYKCSRSHLMAYTLPGDLPVSFVPIQSIVLFRQNQQYGYIDISSHHNTPLVKKHVAKLLSISSLNTDRFSTFFHSNTLWNIWNNKIIKYPTMP